MNARGRSQEVFLVFAQGVPSHEKVIPLFFSDFSTLLIGVGQLDVDSTRESFPMSVTIYRRQKLEER